MAYQKVKFSSLLITLVVLTVLAAIVISPSEAAGCYKGFCWSWCESKESGKWCYTTRGKKGDGGWIGCDSIFADCREDYQCGGVCHDKNDT